METGTYPRVMYHTSGSTRRVETAQLETALSADGWALTPFPPPPEEPKRPTGIQGQLQDLHDRVLILESMLLKRQKGGK